MGNIEVRKLSPAADSMPSVESLPEDFREAFLAAWTTPSVGTKLSDSDRGYSSG